MPKSAISLAEEIYQPKSKVKRLNNENKRIQQERGFEATVFLTLKRRK